MSLTLARLCGEWQLVSKENWILGEGNLDIREGFHNILERLSSDPS